MRLAKLLASLALSAAITLLGISVIVFVAMQLVPGSFADMMLGPKATPEARARLEARYGLDQPLPVQYANWLLAMGQGDLGTSMISDESIASELKRRLPASIELALLGMAISLSLGIPLGLLSGWNASRRLLGTSTRFTAAFMMSIPEFVLGVIFVYVFSVYDFGLTVGGYVPFLEDPITNLRAMILPAVTLCLFGAALIARTSRAAVITVLNEPYVSAAVARGATPSQILRRHVVRNSAIPVVTVVAPMIGYYVGGAVIIEMLFSVPGVGRWILNGISRRDYAVVQVGVLLGASVFVLMNMAADFAYAILDPRVGTSRAQRRGK